MSKESLKKFFEDLNEKDGLKQGLIDYCGEPKTKDEAARLFAEYAQKKGYDVTAKEIYDCFVAGESEKAESGKITPLDDEKLAAIAGGGFGKFCKNVLKGAAYVLGFTNSPDW